jgi:hypothetical protein
MYTGKDAFTFWFGVVEDRMDPLELGRCRVRILGFHPETRKDFPTEKLPWASTIQSSTSYFILVWHDRIAKMHSPFPWSNCFY